MLLVPVPFVILKFVELALAALHLRSTRIQRQYPMTTSALVYCRQSNNFRCPSMNYWKLKLYMYKYLLPVHYRSAFRSLADILSHNSGK